MSDENTLYRTSVSPPQDFYLPYEHRVNSIKLEYESSREDSLSPLAGPSYRAPIALMTAPPIKHGQSVVSKASPNANDKGKGRAVDISPPPPRPAKGDQAYYQAQADRIEGRRDLEDPDFQAGNTQSSETVVADMSGPSLASMLKRRYGMGSDASEEEEDDSSPLKKKQMPTPPQKKQIRDRKKADGCNMRYVNLKQASKDERDQDIDRIHDNWHVPKTALLPESLMQYREHKLPKGEVEKVLLEPRDWNGKVLQKLAYLSGITRNRAAEVCNDLEASMNRKGREGPPRLMWRDIEFVAKKFENLDRGRAPYEGRSITGQAFNGRTLEVGMEETSLDDTIGKTAAAATTRTPEAVLPSPRSPSFGTINTPVKQESSSGSAKNVESARGVDGTTGLDSDEEVLAYKLIVAEEKQRLAEARIEAAQIKIMLEKRRRESGKAGKTGRESVAITLE